MRDNRSYKIKRILKNKFKNAKFKVRIEKYAGGESIHIYTDLLNDLKEYTQLELKLRKGEKIDMDKYLEEEKKFKKNEEIINEIKKLLKDFYHIRYDEYTREILSGGNTILFVERLEE